MEVEVQVLKGDFHQSPDFSNFHANLPICHMFPRTTWGLLVKAKEGEGNERAKVFLM